jgi:hypothetical protein
LPSTRGILAQQNIAEMAVTEDLTSFTKSLLSLNQLYLPVSEYDYAKNKI